MFKKRVAVTCEDDGMKGTPDRPGGIDYAANVEDLLEPGHRCTP